MRDIGTLEARDYRSTEKVVGGWAKCRTQNGRDVGAEPGWRENKSSGEPGPFEFPRSYERFSRGRFRFLGRDSFLSCFLPGFLWTHVNIPTTEADIRLAIVPASIARIPNLASWLRCSGARAPIPPIWMPMELKFAKPQSAKVAMVNERGSSVAFNAPNC